MFVDSVDADCGMEVIRWLCREPRPHLKGTLFFVHTHNATAGLLMVLQMHCGGYRAEYRPFGLDLQRVLAHSQGGAAVAAGRPSWTDRLAPGRGLGGLFGGLSTWGDRLGLARDRARQATAGPAGAPAAPGSVTDRPPDPGP
jgi:hypothetical protein